MTGYGRFEELEACVPVSQLVPSVAFRRCSASVPQDIDLKDGAELVESLTAALSLHTKARVVLQCWVLLIMRRRVDEGYAKNAMYDRLQDKAVSPQEKVRYRRGAMLLCHLLIERAEAGEANSLLDRYMVDFYFPWSEAVNYHKEPFYLSLEVVPWVRQALNHLTQTGSKLTGAGWKRRTPSSTSPPLSPSTATASRRLRSAVQLSTPHLSTTVPDTSELDTVSAAPTVDETMATLAHTRLRSATPRTPDRIELPSNAAGTSPSTCASSTTKKRRRASGVVCSSSAAHLPVHGLRKSIRRWANGLRRQLLQAVKLDDKDRMRHVAEQLRAPPLDCTFVRISMKRSGGNEAEDGSQSEIEDDSNDSADEEEEGEDEEEEEERGGDRCQPRQRRRHQTMEATIAFTDSDHNSSDSEQSSSSNSDSSQPDEQPAPEECAVCAEERMQEVWSPSCNHGFCGVCLFKRLDGRVRRCLICQTHIANVRDRDGRVYQQDVWLKQWRLQHPPT